MVRSLSQMYLLLTSISGVFMGMNCVLFFFCVYVLWGQKARSRRLLLFSSTVQVCLCLAQISLFITNFCVAYTLHASDTEGYFLRLSEYALSSYIIYIINNAIEGVLFIWRIYILYNHSTKACIPTTILLALQVAFAGAAAKGAATRHVNVNRLHAFDLVSWALIAAVNASATILISLRLWIARQNALANLSQCKYKSTIIVVVECGALMTVCTIAMLILHIVKRPVGISGLGITTQLATMVPLLIIARYGLLTRRDDARRLPKSQIPLRISVMRTEDTRVDTPVEFTRKSRCHVSDSFPPFPGPSGNHPKPFCDT